MMGDIRKIELPKTTPAEVKPPIRQSGKDEEPASSPPKVSPPDSRSGR
jgi:hypothetical protein